jgi:hypothetical protein
MADVEAIPPSPSVDIPGQKKKSPKWIIVGIAVLLLANGFNLYLWIKDRLQIEIFQHEFSLAKYPELAIVPTPLVLPSIVTSTSQQFSYHGVTFNVPWNQLPRIDVRLDNVSQLNFPGGQFVLISASSSYAGITRLPGSSPSSSDYDYLNDILNAVPVSGTSYHDFMETSLAARKVPFFAWLGNGGQPMAIYSFSRASMNGLDLAGDNPPPGRQLGNITFLFNLQGQAVHDFIIASTTQEEADFILASLQMR